MDVINFIGKLILSIVMKWKQQRAAAAVEPSPLPTAARPPACSRLCSALPTRHHALSESASTAGVSGSTPDTWGCHILACCGDFAASPPPPKRQPLACSAFEKDTKKLRQWVQICLFFQIQEGHEWILPTLTSSCHQPMLISEKVDTDERTH
jgi:hypothetical protein